MKSVIKVILFQEQWMAQQEKFKFHYTFQGTKYANGICSFYIIFNRLSYFKKPFYAPCVLAHLHRLYRSQQTLQHLMVFTTSNSQIFDLLFHVLALNPEVLVQLLNQLNQSINVDTILMTLLVSDSMWQVLSVLCRSGYSHRISGQVGFRTFRLSPVEFVEDCDTLRKCMCWGCLVVTYCLPLILVHQWGCR